MTKKDNPLPSLRGLEVSPRSNSSSASPAINTPSASPHSQPSSSRHSPQRPTPLTSETRPSPSPKDRSSNPDSSEAKKIVLADPKDFAGALSSEEEGEEGEMETRPPLHRPTDGRSHDPLLLKEERGRPSYDVPNSNARPAFVARRSTFRSRSPNMEGSKAAVRRKYIYAAFFLVVSLISFVIQTETAVYIQHDLKWEKPYAMLYFTHGSWSLLWPTMLLVLRISRWSTPWRVFWRRHLSILRNTAQMVQSRDLHLTSRESHRSPVLYMVRTMAIVTTSLTVAGASWYVAVDLTSPSDLTAIYNCSAFFAYAFSIPLLGDKLRFDKVFAVIVAIAGVLMVVYLDKGDDDESEAEIKNRTLGNFLIGIGSVLYGLYEVLYKRLACPPEGLSAGKGMIFANLFGSLIGCFTLGVLWIPLPILHVLGYEKFELPTGKAAKVLLISVLANATFSGSFLILMSLTSPVLSSVASLLTIFLVALADWAFVGKKLSGGAIAGGLLIIGAFLLLSWATYKEMVEEREKKFEQDPIDTDEDD